MRIIAIDPGGTTGWATCVLGDKVEDPLWKPKLEDHFEDCGQLTGDHHYKLRQLLSTKNPDVIVRERFEHRNNEFAQLVSCEYIGVVKMWSQQYKRRLVMQGASQAKPWVSTKKLVKLGLWLQPADAWGHAIDARRHLVYYLIFNSGNQYISTKLLQALKGL